jgi:serine/threonine protein kinase/Tol biopolymer transport system component
VQTTSNDAAGMPQQIGPYQVVAKLGEGGMGVVYRARDARLNREVALKVLPPALAEDPTRMARFEREAQLLASLNHPRIAAIYGVEESGPTRALVMELVEGPTLAERIGPSIPRERPKAGSGSPAQPTRSASGAKQASAAAASSGHARKSGLPIDEALPIAQQIAEALEYAHEHGVIHRDLKPANIKVTPDGDVKVLDFGLARAMGPEEASADVSNSPTLSLAMTQAGFILGTAAYMAPEQAKQKQVDRRADIWAFGCVLYEMLTGRMTFHGETVTDTLAEIIKSEPDWNALPADTPLSVQRLLRRCLVKDPRQRLRDIGDARVAIEETLSGAATETEGGGPAGQVAAPTSTARHALPWALGAATVLLAGLAAWLLLQPKAPRNVIRFSISSPENMEFVYGGEGSISPDGRTLAFVAQAGPEQPPMLWVRRFDSLTAVEIPGTEGAFLPFWSPDSQWIGLEAGGKLDKVAVSGGPVQTLCNEGILGATWSRDGVILFSNAGHLYRVPDTGGTPALVLAPGSTEHYWYPQFLPDGRHFLFLISKGSASAGFAAVGSLDSASVQRLTQVSTDAIYAAPGYLFYREQNTLMARPFDAGALRFTGPAVPIAQKVGEFTGPHYGYFTVSSGGVLAYQTQPDAATSQMTWFNRAGQKLGTIGQPAVYTNPGLSADGTRLAVGVGELGKTAIWVYDLKRETASRLTFSPSDETNPLWTPDGRRILFSSNRTGPYGIYQIAADGLGSTQKIFQSKTQQAAIDDVTADGKYALYDTASDPGSIQLWVLPLTGGGQPFPFVQGHNSGAANGQFSPNGRYVAYASNETGEAEVYVQSFPQQTGRWQISASGGTQPMWRHDGKELYYLGPDGKLMAVAVDTTAATFQAGIPRELFQTQLVPTSFWRNIYLPSPDGQRFLMITPASQAKPEPITVVMNWPTLLQGRN